MCEGVHSKQEINLKKFFIVQKEGNCEVKREIAHYNLDIIIAIGYRVQSDVAVRFRHWATQRLHEYIQKGFTMDDERLKQVLHTLTQVYLQSFCSLSTLTQVFFIEISVKIW